ncbi:hypothetical protein BWR18_09435 [Tateyamaria omphalii]|uniref:Uncharacterized protein n=2 Tax=Tateyamaria omphalii TaxID=299262 RepID=A0A1P8MUV2_9RHOB|nr:hypothetical protein BWR18_09435 [Tateyamaria omphalii]
MLARAFCSDQLDAVAQNFTYPVPLYTKGELLVFGAPTALSEALTMYRDAARRAGIVRMTPRVIAAGLPQKGYSSLWVEWDHYDSADALICTSQVRYAIFKDAMALHPKIEMIDYTCLGLPEVCEALPLMKSA